MFSPVYTITNSLLSSIKQVYSLVIELNLKQYPHTILSQFEKAANAVSSFASTSIEGNPLHLTDVKRILKSQPQTIHQSEQEVLNYNKALEQLNADLKKGTIEFHQKLILRIQKQVVTKLIPDYQQGAYRREPVFVNDPKLRQTIYWPPDHQDINLLIQDLIDFIYKNKGTVDPIILAGLFHKQFVIIHPFMDGNGRTARLATKALLHELGLDTFQLFSFENYYNQNVTRYFQSVGERGNYYDIKNHINFTSWLEYFAQGIVEELMRVKKELSKLTSSPLTELKPYHYTIINHIKEFGYIKDADYAKQTKRAKATRSLDFGNLLKRGILKRKGKGKSTFYLLKA